MIDESKYFKENQFKFSNVTNLKTKTKEKREQLEISVTETSNDGLSLKNNYFFDKYRNKHCTTSKGK